MGDRQAGMCLAAGILAALYKARETSRDERVSVSLMATSIFMQATLIQATQYGKIEYPVRKQEILNPLMSCYKTKDDRFIQLALPVHNIFMPLFAKAMSHEEWIENERFKNFGAMGKGHRAEFYDTVAARFAELTTEEAEEILTRADLPFSVARVWKEVLEDSRAWATDCFLKKGCPSGGRIAVRNPVRFENAGLPPYEVPPQLGQNTREVLESIGFSEDKITQLQEDKQIRCS